MRRSGIAISPAERRALWDLAAHGPITADALAARLGLDPTDLGELFEALGRRGYVQPDPQGVPDLTAQGRRAIVALVRARHDEQQRAGHALADPRRGAAGRCDGQRRGRPLPTPRESRSRMDGAHRNVRSVSGRIVSAMNPPVATGDR